MLEDQVNVLLVDDRPDKLLALESLLGDPGLSIVKARSGDEALRFLLSQDFAVILLDVNMPGLDGFETAALLRQRQAHAQTPIIFISAFSDTETHLSRGYSLGAVDYIRSPIEPEILRAKVAVFVDLYRKSRQVREQARQLEATVAELSALNSELEAFSYSVSHDLRAPLRHVSGFVDLLQRRAGPALDETSRRYLEVIAGSAQRMGRLIDDLLAFSRMGRAEFHRSRVDLEEMVREVIAELDHDTTGREVVFEVGELPPVTGDPAMLRLALANLISNALKYSAGRRPARIQIGSLSSPSREATVFVRDNGVGFDMQYAGKLFGVFQRLHRSENFEGTGIGLATVRRIVERHGGRTWAEGAVDEGATFFFTLPLAGEGPPR